MRQTIQFIKENYGAFAFNKKNNHPQQPQPPPKKKKLPPPPSSSPLKEEGDICLEPNSR